MDIKKMVGDRIGHSATQELKMAFSRYQDEECYQGGSLEGRRVCLIMVAGHVAGIIVKPIYEFLHGIAKVGVGVIVGVGGIFAGIFAKKENKENLRAELGGAGKSLLKGGGKEIGAAIVAPIGQVAQTAKAIAGVIHPGAYFKQKPR